jgi:hypothetical protein
VTLGLDASGSGTQGLVVFQKDIESVRKKINFWDRQPDVEAQPSGHVALGSYLLPPLTDSLPLAERLVAGAKCYRKCRDRLVDKAKT